MRIMCRILGHDFGIRAVTFTYVGRRGVYVCRRCGHDLEQYA